MDVVALKDGSIEIIGNHRDLVDIIRDKCGDDIAKGWKSLIQYVMTNYIQQILQSGK